MSRFYYFDSSSWVKLYIEEPGSELVRLIYYNNAREHCFVSTLGYVEVCAAVARRQQSKRLTDADLSRLNQVVDGDFRVFTKIAISDDVYLEAVIVARTFRLRGADAGHLATTLLADALISNRRERVVMLTADRELLAASILAGLQAQDPSVDTVRPM